MLNLLVLLVVLVADLLTVRACAPSFMEGCYSGAIRLSKNAIIKLTPDGFVRRAREPFMFWTFLVPQGVVILVALVVASGILLKLGVVLWRAFVST